MVALLTNKVGERQNKSAAGKCLAQFAIGVCTARVRVCLRV